MGYNAPNDVDVINQQGDGIIISLTNALMTLLIGSYHDDIISNDGIGGRWDMGG